MRSRLLIAVLGLAALAILTVPATADAKYHVGYTYSDKHGSWTLAADGYWYDAQRNAYTLHEETKQVWNKYKGCYEWVTYYDYELVKPAVAQVTINNINPRDPDRWVKLMELLKSRESDNAFLKAMQGAGLLNDSQPGYGVGAFQRLDSYGTSGATLYSRESIDIYAQPVDLNVLYQQASRHTDTALRLGAQANTDFANLVQLQGDAAARVAEIQAKGRAVEAYLKALPTPRTQIQREFRGPAPQAMPKVGIQAVPPPPSAQASCLSCHSGPEPAGGLDISDWSELTPQQLGNMTARVAKGEMPPKNAKVPPVSIKVWLKELQ